jgi:hypothetical protein
MRRQLQCRQKYRSDWVAKVGLLVRQQFINSHLLWTGPACRRDSVRSSSVHLICGVSRCSMHGPIRFILYIADCMGCAAALMKENGLLPHQYADDTKICGVLFAFISRLVLFVSFQVCWWYCQLYAQFNRLQMNPERLFNTWRVTAWH